MVSIVSYLRFVELFNKLERHFIGRFITLLRKVPPHLVSDSDAWCRVLDWLTHEMMNLDIEKFADQKTVELCELRKADEDEDSQDEFMVHARMLTVTFQLLWAEVYNLFTDRRVELGKRDQLRVFHGFILESLAKIGKKRVR